MAAAAGRVAAVPLMCRSVAAGGCFMLLENGGKPYVASFLNDSNNIQYSMLAACDSTNTFYSSPRTGVAPVCLREFS